MLFLYFVWKVFGYFVLIWWQTDRNFFKNPEAVFMVLEESVCLDRTTNSLIIGSDNIFNPEVNGSLTP